jgi:hypothetical protein
LRYQILQSLVWATFWAISSRKHLVTLDASQREFYEWSKIGKFEEEKKEKFGIRKKGLLLNGRPSSLNRCPNEISI